MATDISSIRTLQDVINVLSVVYFNMNEIERIYYDMFINPEPLDVTFERYNDAGVLEDITLPNRAKDRTNVLTGAGSPNSVVSASAGALYLDITNLDLYYKATGSDAYGWIKLYSTYNLKEGEDYLAPDGDASQLTNLNMSNAGSGTLAVTRGGTGSNGLTGIVKGNGASAYTAAIDGVDYLGPNSMTGLIAFYPIDTIPTGWLRCDGSAYSRTTYARLFSIIGTTYGNGDGSTTFNVPDLYNYFIRGWDGSTPFNTVQQDQVGKHTHTLTGTTGEESAHTHTKGNMSLSGSVSSVWTQRNSQATGCFRISYSYGGVWGTDGAMSYSTISLNSDGGWTGTTSGGSAHSHTLTGNTDENTTASGTSETRVLNKMLVPVIKY